MKLESLVIADQHAAVNSYLSFVHTARHAPEIHFAGCLEKNINSGKLEYKVMPWKISFLSFENLQDQRKMID